MSTDLQVFQENTSLQLADAFKDVAGSDLGGALSAGVSGNYPILSMRGGKWRVKYQGVEHPIIDAKGDAVPSLELVIVKANPFLTKQYFAGGYTEGSTDSPVCWSLDGKAPAANVPEPQHTNCALCPMNKFGSRVTPAGVEVKACQDNRKIAVVPLADLENKQFGGPMLFRVPASALKDLAMFGQTMQARGYPYFAVATRVGFDLEVSHPKPTFKAIRPLNAEEAPIVRELMDSPAVENVLGGEVAAPHEATRAPAAPKPDPDFEIPPQQLPTMTVVAPPAVPPAAAPAPTQGVSFGTTPPAAPAAPAKPRGRKPQAAPAAAPAPAPAAVAGPTVTPAIAARIAAASGQPAAPATAAPSSQLEDDISALLSELNGA